MQDRGHKISGSCPNNTRTVISLPAHKTFVACKWVFKVKLHANGTEERKKVRLVAKGFTQEAGLDYEETFSRTTNLVTVKNLLAVAAQKQWHLHQLNINNVFLHDELDEKVDMSMPPSYEQRRVNGEPLVCKLNKSIYGLKQASRQWNTKLYNLSRF